MVPSAMVRDTAQGYCLLNCLLVQKWLSHRDTAVDKPFLQVVVPTAIQQKVLQASHCDVAGHFGVGKTYNRILKHFFWPRLKKDVALFIKTCDTCQLTGKPNQTVNPATLRPISVSGKPFEYLIMDCVGPQPQSKSGYTYLLTVMCQVIRYPDAYLLCSINTKAVVGAVTQFITVFGIPKVIQSDRGSNFTSNLFAQVLCNSCMLNITKKTRELV